MTSPCAKWKEWRDCAANSWLEMAGRPYVFSPSQPVQQDPSFPCQFHRWWKSLKLPKQGQSAHSFCLKMGKWNTQVRPNAAESGSPSKQWLRQKPTGNNNNNKRWSKANARDKKGLGAKGLWGSRGRPSSESNWAWLPGLVDTVGPGTGVATVVELWWPTIETLGETFTRGLCL